MNLGTATVIRADSRSLPLADDSVDLVVTSPPYFALRSYQDGGEHYAGQIGSEPTPSEFVDALLEVTRECVRVLKPSGSLWVNLGDKYSGAQAQNIAGANRAGDSARTWAQTNPKTTGIPNKSLMGIPWRYALRCIDDLGLILRAEVIWSKPNGLPESVTDRVRRSHEQWFHFTLEPRYFSAVDEIREEHLSTWGGRPNGGHAHKKAQSGVNAESNLDVSMPNPLGKLPGSVWTVPTEPLKVPDHLGIDHFAAFPTEWPKRIIQGWSPAGICVECREGRRPIADETGRVISSSTNPDRQALLGGDGNKYRGRNDAGTYLRVKGGPQMAKRERILNGHSCACGTQRGDTWTPVTSTKTASVSGEPHADSVDGGANSGTDDITPRMTAPATLPAVVLDPFGGTGTTAMVAKALGRHGISVDMSADYCRLAEWRTNDRDQLAKVLGIAKAEQQDAAQLELFEGGAA